MRTRLFALVGFTLAATVLAQQPPARFEISGTVVDHRTQAPLASILVSVTPVGNARGESLSVVTAADGSFHFTALAQGKYALAAERRGSQTRAFQAHGQFSTAVATGPAIDSQHIIFPLIADARISGSVLDEEGDPVQNAQVYLLSKHVVDGKSRVDMRSQQHTSVAGAFHFGHLKPGTYYLAVSARPWYEGNDRIVTRADPSGKMVQELAPAPAVLDQCYPITYSGDSTEASAAQPLNLPEGGSLTAQISLRAMPSARVSIPDSEGVPLPDRTSPGGGGFMGRRMGGGGYQITAEGPGGVPIPVQNNFVPRAGSDRAGEQDIKVAPGTYQVRRQINENGHTIASEEVIQVGGSGLAQASKISATFLTGRLTFSSPASQETISLQLNGERRHGAVPVQPDGSFAFPQPVTPGHYRLAVLSESSLSVQAVGDGKHSYAGNTLVIPPGAPSSLEISVVAGPSSTSAFPGMAVRDGKPISGAMVLLVPENVSEEAWIGRDQSDSDGSFSIPNVQPGRYVLLAFDCTGEDESCGIEYRNPVFMKPLLSQGQPVTVPLAGKDKVEATVLAAVSPR